MAGLSGGLAGAVLGGALGPTAALLGSAPRAHGGAPKTGAGAGGLYPGARPGCQASFGQVASLPERID